MTALSFRLIAVFVGLLSLTGCVRPDRWYDTRTLYDDMPAVAGADTFTAIETPEPQIDAPPLLPDIERNTMALSLEQAVVLGLQRNSELRIQLFEPVIAGAFEQIERGIFDPELFAELGYARETTSETSRSTGERFNVEGEDADLDAGVRMRLPAGTDIETALEFNRITSNRTPDQHEARIGLSITQSLLQGLGPAVNLVDIRQARLATRSSLYELRGFTEALVAEIETAYWLYVLAEEGIDIFQRSLDIARRQLHEVEQRIEVGALPRNAAAAARAETARREQALIDALSDKEDRRLRLLRLLNAVGEQQFALDITTSSKPRTTSVHREDLGDRLELAYRLRPDLNEAYLRRGRNRLEIVRTRNGLLPRLELFIDLGKTGYAESFGSAVNNLDSDTHEVTAGLRLSHYFNNRSAKARDLAARASYKQAEAAIANLRNLVELDVRLAANEAERAGKQIDAGAVTRKLQEQTLQAEQERFSVGNSTSLLVAQAQRDLLVSQLAEIEAIVNYRIALVNLYLAEGSLLERRGINMEVDGI